VIDVQRLSRTRSRRPLRRSPAPLVGDYAFDQIVSALISAFNGLRRRLALHPSIGIG
jgi:hypothetical protein